MNSVIALAKTLGLPTIAEGIEHQGTMAQVLEGSADFGQGFYFGKAMRADDAGKLLGIHPTEEFD